MGEAKRRAEKDTGAVPPTLSVKLAAPKYAFRKSELQGPDGPVPKATASANVTRTLLQSAVQAAHPQGLDRRDARIWGRILDTLGDLDADTLTLIESDFDWLRKTFGDDTLKLPANLSHWRCALLDYLDDLHDAHRKASS